MKDYVTDITVKPQVKGFFDPATNTISYVVKDPESEACAIVDSVMDIDYAAGRISYGHADEIIAHVRENGLRVEWLIETHVHADHLSAAPYIQGKLGGRLGIGRNITVVQETFGKVFNEGTEFQRDGSQFDRLFDDGDTYSVGGMSCLAIHTPGHTPACMTHVMGDAAFVGDTLFMPDAGSARADFPGGDAGQLYELDPEGAEPAGRDAALHVPRLCPERPRHPLGDNRRRGEGAQHPRWSGQVEGGVRQVPHRARRPAWHAKAHHPLAPGEHARRRVAAG